MGLALNPFSIHSSKSARKMTAKKKQTSQLHDQTNLTNFPKLLDKLLFLFLKIVYVIPPLISSSSSTERIDSITLNWLVRVKENPIKGRKWIDLFPAAVKAESKTDDDRRATNCLAAGMEGRLCQSWLTMASQERHHSKAPLHTQYAPHTSHMFFFVQLVVWPLLFCCL